MTCSEACRCDTIAVNMTTTLLSAPVSQALIDIVADLSRDLGTEERYRRLLACVRSIFPCDAAALLKLRGVELQPLAVNGLSEDTLGRRFVVAEHPRLARILESASAVRFGNSDLPDPYDGLVESGALGDVHDCMGARLYVGGQVWGVLTLDAMRPDAFDEVSVTALPRFVLFVEASIRAAESIERLRQQVVREQHQNIALQAELGGQELIGQSAAMQELRRQIATVAQSDLLVLLQGETGVGKEVVARQIHALSARAGRALVNVNCAALPETLAESELFGHVRGAFTGATTDRPGKFELADGGTLLLDEVGELPLLIQAKLLRVLQSGELQRVGSDRAVHVDVRVIAATNRNLAAEVAAGRFRADLYHRLSVFPILVPPLRERGRDVLELAGHFLAQSQARLKVRNIGLSATSCSALLEYSWPGNVRELQHVISRAALLAVTEWGRGQRFVSIVPENLNLPGAGSLARQAEPHYLPPAPVSRAVALSAATDAFQRQWLEALIAEHRGNLAATARAAGIDRSNLLRLLRRLGVR